MRPTCYWITFALSAFVMSLIIYCYLPILNNAIDTKSPAFVSLAEKGEMYHESMEVKKEAKLRTKTAKNYTNGSQFQFEETSSKHTYEVQTRKCRKPVLKFVFIKTHKTGGTSLRFILTRIIEFYNQTKNVAIHQPVRFIGGYPGHFKCKFMWPRGASIVVRHTRFDAVEMKRCFHAATRYFTILRYPWYSFQSAYHFYLKKFEQGPSCKGMPISYVNKGQTLDVNQFLLKSAPLLNKSIPFYFRFRNFQAHDLGMDPMLKNQAEIEQKFQALDKTIDLVLILEYMEESLVLLKELLCIPWKILGGIVKTNHRTYTRKPTFLTEFHKTTFENMNNIDIALYAHFNKTLWQRVDSYGREKMARDVQRLRTMTKRSVKTEHSTGQEQYDETYEQAKPLIKQYMSENSGGCFMP